MKFTTSKQIMPILAFSYLGVYHSVKEIVKEQIQVAHFYTKIGALVFNFMQFQVNLFLISSFTALC
jgi:hypothetical protein